MPIVVVEAVAPTSSWRPPEAQNYHPSYPLPPYTSQVGLLGAAIGLALPDAFAYVRDRELKLGVGGWHNGRMRDLWKFQKLESIADPKKEINHDIVLREHFVDTRLIFVIETPSQETADQVASAFREPKYPLTAGVSDALMHARRVSVRDETPNPTKEFAFTLVYRDIAANYKVDASMLESQPMMRSLQAPTTERIATGFRFNDAGSRSLAARAVVTFIGDRIALADDDEPVDAYDVEPSASQLRRELQSWNFKTLSIPVHRYD